MTAMQLFLIAALITIAVVIIVLKKDNDVRRTIRKTSEDYRKEIDSITDPDKLIVYAINQGIEPLVAQRATYDELRGILYNRFVN